MGKSAAATENAKAGVTAEVSVSALPATKDQTAAREFAQTTATMQLDMECVTSAFVPACARKAGLAMRARSRTAPAPCVSLRRKDCSSLLNAVDMARALTIIVVPAVTDGVALTAQQNCAHMTVMVNVGNAGQLATRQNHANAKRK